MYVPILPTEPLVVKSGDDYELNKPWKNLFEQQQSNMQQCLSDEGFLIPTVSSANNSVTPSAAGGQVAQLEATFGTQGGISAGTIIFDSNETNGATPPAKNGQLKVMLLDGTFHPITNT